MYNEAIKKSIYNFSYFGYFTLKNGEMNPIESERIKELSQHM